MAAAAVPLAAQVLPSAADSAAAACGAAVMAVEESAAAGGALEWAAPAGPPWCVIACAREQTNALFRVMSCYVCSASRHLRSIAQP